MNLKNRLSKLEQVKRKITIEAACICFPPNEPPKLQLRGQPRGLVPNSRRAVQPLCAAVDIR